MKRYLLILTGIFLAVAPVLQAQVSNDSLLESGTLENIIKYTLVHQPAIQKSLLDERITKSQVNSRLADWYPQIGYNYSFQHNFQLQYASFAGQVIQLGTRNSSMQQFAYTQNILNPTLVFTATTAGDVKKASAQVTAINKTDVVAQVSKAFYDVLLTQQQINVSNENITRLERSVKDTRAQYQSGIVDKTDYQRATILLNNAIALKKSNEEALKAKTEYLKSIMGYPAKANLAVVYDSVQMEGSVTYDVAQQVNYNNRPEYQLLQTQRQLQVGNLKYSKLAFLPSVQGFAAYNMNYLNDDATKLYNANYPNSYAGITIAVPLVAGGKRWMNIRQAQWQLKKADWDLNGMESNINAQYAQALAAYNSSLAAYNAVKENLDLARDVYNTIQLQYKSGVKTYLEVLIAESDLRTTQINYYNALYQVLSGKVDLQKATGEIKY
ncbi:MAG TPA: TolC family protein [Chitinophagales bacterium]|nr:TolC family protein [Chitinophagales bacterium]